MSNHSIVQRILETLADFEARKTSAYRVNEAIEIHRHALESVPREAMDKLRELATELLYEDISDLEREQMGWEDQSAKKILLMRNILNTIADPDRSAFEKVYVENEWYDGPRAGIADIHGIPHRFKSNYDEQADGYLSTFLVWPVSSKELELEVEQWGIFVEWNAQYESGEVETGSHPGRGGVSARWDEIDALVRDSRNHLPGSARLATAQLRRIDREQRYETSGPDYLLCWRFSPSGE